MQRKQKLVSDGNDHKKPNNYIKYINELNQLIQTHKNQTKRVQITVVNNHQNLQHQ